MTTRECWLLGGGLASDENSLSLPLVTNEFEGMRNLVAYLCHLYGIEFVSTPWKTIVLVRDGKTLRRSCLSLNVC